MQEKQLISSHQILSLWLIPRHMLDQNKHHTYQLPTIYLQNLYVLRISAMKAKLIITKFPSPVFACINEEKTEINGEENEVDQLR